MRAGRLDRVITVERSTETLDDAGTPAVAWASIATLRAEIIRAGAEEIVSASGSTAETVTMFRTRYLAGLTVADRIVYEGAFHDIKAVLEIGRRRGLEIRTVERSAP